MSYSPVLGRFIQRDPLGYVDGGSLYASEEGSPVGSEDPSGLFVTTTRWRGRDWNLEEWQVRAFNLALLASHDFLHPMAARFIDHWLSGDGSDLIMAARETAILASSEQFTDYRLAVLKAYAASLCDYLGDRPEAPFDVSSTSSGHLAFGRPSTPLTDGSADADSFFAFGTLEQINVHMRGRAVRTRNGVCIEGTLSWSVADRYEFKPRAGSGWTPVVGTRLDDDDFFQLQQMGMARPFTARGTWDEPFAYCGDCPCKE